MVKTQYIAPLSLWVVVRRRVLESGLFIEPAWTESAQENISGPVIFVSRLLAHMYAYLRNEHHGADDTGHWKAIPLQDFNLLEHAHAIDGPLYCMLAFGFSMDTATDVICVHAPRIRYVPLPFRLPKDIQGITFSFNQWAFDFMNDEWTSLGLPNYARELEAVDELDDIGFNRLYQTAAARLGVCHTPSGNDGLWAVFGAREETWISGYESETPRAPARGLH
ncbi:hypothetical protein [Burkholderia aenigmatica]|uniref:hypothetical protein n=1 Tax=Burkholderia aenigmatica TaxID=2015348 RepID=UPI00265014A7|nr:hypothetical protein [Burkholderia aenigmatica]MDN7877015.1 hypothetical protein [Burkholderia aenigmatica]